MFCRALPKARDKNAKYLRGEIFVGTSPFQSLLPSAGIIGRRGSYRSGMKKKIVLSVCIILVFALILVTAAACNRQGTEEPSYISGTVTSYYVGEDDSFAVVLESGEREDPFIADGRASGAKPFTELSVTPLVAGEYDEISYTVYGGEGDAESVTGKLPAGKFGEFKAETKFDFIPSKISLTAGDKTAEIELRDVLAGALTASDAINVAKELFAERIAEEESAGKTPREIYVKLITGDRETYYFYVSFIGEGTDYWAALIDPSDGRVVSER